MGRDQPSSAEASRGAHLANVIGSASVLVLGMITALLGLGGAAPGGTESERRPPSPLPPITWESVLEGRVTSAFEAYLADRVPARGAWLDVESALRSARGFGRADEDVVFYGVSSEAMELGAELDRALEADEAPDAELDFDREDLRAESATAELGSPLSLVASAHAQPAESDAATRVSAGVLIRDGRAMQVFGGRDEGAPGYARAINEIHAAVGDRATLYALIVPTAQTFYLPRGSSRRGRDERPSILGTYARLDPGIRAVDAHAELAEHTGEAIYFRTDHHWTGLGAYYGYRALCRAAGREPIAIERMQRRVVDERWLGSLFRLTRDRELRPDAVEILVPPGSEGVQLRRGTHETPYVLFAEHLGGYEVFLGGDRPLIRLHTASGGGRRAIVVKNSYGNALVPYLVPHYEEIVLVDYRLYQGGIVPIVEESDMPTDLVFVNGAITASSSAHSELIAGLAHRRRRAGR